MCGLNSRSSFLLLRFGPSPNVTPIQSFVFLGELSSPRISLLVLDDFDIPDIGQYIIYPHICDHKNLLPLLELLKLSVCKELIHHGGFPCLVRHPVRVKVCSVVHHSANLTELGDFSVNKKNSLAVAALYPTHFHHHGSSRLTRR